MIFYWMRLFESTAFYVLMISETMWDIRHFLIMFALCVAMFANALLILDLSQLTASENAEPVEGGEPEEYERIIPESLDNNVVDSFINQYLLGVGEFTIDPYPANRAKTLIWIYFMAATIMTNINFLNLLVAIISDTYARITEAK
jgi:hypothetical protein